MEFGLIIARWARFEEGTKAFETGLKFVVLIPRHLALDLYPVISSVIRQA